MSEFNKFADLMIEAAYQENIKNLGKPMAELMKQSVIQLKPVIEIFFNKGMEIGKAQAVPEWISVDGSVKPKDEQIVLVVRKDTINGLPIYDTAKYDAYENVFECYGRSDTVSHWMPLPGLPNMIEAQE